MNGLTGPLFNIGTLASRGLMNRGPTPGSPNEQEDIFKRISDLLSNAPKRKDPSVLGRIGALLSGFSSDERGRGFRYDPSRVREAIDAPYNRELRDWQAEAAPLLQQYELETKRDETELGRLEALATIEGQGALKDQREASAQLSRARIAEIAENINSHDYTNPIFDNDSYIVMDRKSGEVFHIDSNRMTEKERIRFEQAAMGERQRSVEGARQAGRLAIEDKRAAREAAEEDTPLTPAAERTAIANKAAEVMSKYPELADYINIMQNGVVVISAPKGVDEDTAMRNTQLAKKLIYPSKDINLKDENLGVISDTRTEPGARPTIQPPPTQPLTILDERYKPADIDEIINEYIASNTGKTREDALAELRRMGIIR